MVLRCAYCQIELTTTSSALSHQRRATRDHIVPQMEGGTTFLAWSYALPPALRVRNWKWACGECNGLRAACGHCVGAMACLQAVASSVKMRPNLVLRAWNRGKQVTPGGRMTRPVRARKRPTLYFDDQPGRTR